ncbi:hypothetical protein [uncultured Roseobacter sp.]|uniref:hypothetical protein n=1 Tax=uncultured Roseobacter sp. TaxID=114847 RepID=UPI002621ED7E|nr:hypothetical protein [uncultured Roseobacter sp.]
MRTITETVFAMALGIALGAQQTAAQTSFLDDTDPKQAIVDACWQMDMTDAVAVYDCLALRTPGSILGRLHPTDDCRKIMLEVAFMMREAYKAKGVRQVPCVYVNRMGESAEHPLPSCEVAAEVIYDAIGVEPIWMPCLGYDPENKKNHFRNCVIAYLVGRNRLTEEVAAQQASSMGCDQLKSLYFRSAMQLAYKEIEMSNGQIWRLPENIEDIDCLEIAEIEF